MIPEPTTSVAATWVAWLSAVMLAFLGVDYYALIGAFGGVLFTVSAVKATTWPRLVATVAITTFAAAVLGQGMAEWLGMTNRKMVLGLCLAFGGVGQIGLQRLFEAAGEAGAAFLRKKGDQ